MAVNTVSQVASFVNENNLIHIDFLNEQTPVVSSFDIARHFDKRHDNILREIDRIISQLPEIFVKLNFEESTREVDTFFGKKKQRCYLLTRDAFSLLAMGFTGSTAIRWKLRYIEAFNAMERGIRSNIRTDALKEAAREIELARESGRRQGYDEGRAVALDELKKAEIVARRETAEAVLALHPKRRETLKKALRYARMGLSCREVAKLLDGNQRQIGHLLSLARKNGLLAPAKQEQGSLLALGSSSGTEVAI